MAPLVYEIFVSSTPFILLSTTNSILLSTDNGPSIWTWVGYAAWNRVVVSSVVDGLEKLQLIDPDFIYWHHDLNESQTSSMHNHLQMQVPNFL